MGCFKVFYHGHACIGIEWQGIKIIIDPHDGHSIGLPPVKDTGDIILVTHEHFDHNAKEKVAKPDSIIVSSFVGEKRIKIKDKEIRVYGYKFPHDRENGKKRGFVSVYKIMFEDTQLMHLGDIGIIPPQKFFEENRETRIDFLFIPVGGVFTIEPYEAWEIAQKLNPIYTVPIHYWRKGMNLPLAPLADFLKFAKTGRVETINPFEYCNDKDNTTEKTKILIYKGLY